MQTFKFWYCNSIKAENLKRAINQDQKVKPKFHSVETVEEETKQGADCIGFNYTPYEEE